MGTINWRLVFLLTFFGLLMAILTVSILPQNIEPYCWLIVFIIIAVTVAKRAGNRFFLHGLLISIGNSIWITIVHVLFASTYLPNHPMYREMIGAMPDLLKNHQRILMLLVGLPFGLAFGVILGLFCLLASVIFKMPAKT